MESMYFVAVVLPKHLDEKILQHKKWMKENYGCKVGLKSPAHITLVSPFWMNAENESELKNNLKTIASAVVPFTVWTNNFAAFKPRTLFVATKENNALNELKIKTVVHTVNDGIELMDYLAKKEDDLPQLLFLDLNMPVMDGFTFLFEFEKLPDNVKQNSKIIVLSSSISPEDINRASTNPLVLKYVNKPLNEKYLSAIER